MYSLLLDTDYPLNIFKYYGFGIQNKRDIITKWQIAFVTKYIPVTQ